MQIVIEDVDKWDSAKPADFLQQKDDLQQDGEEIKKNIISARDEIKN